MTGGEIHRRQGVVLHAAGEDTHAPGPFVNPPWISGFGFPFFPSLRQFRLAGRPWATTLPGVSVHLTILGSGSSGNSAYLETGEVRLLIDAGLSARQIRQRLLTIGRTPENLSGILITHEHSDHIGGLTVLASKLGIPIYCNRLTREAIEYNLKTTFQFRVFATGSSFEIGNLQVEAFSVPHDAMDPVGYMIRTPAGQIGFVTDLGHFTKLAAERLRLANLLVLESNHDLKLLQEDLRRPWSLKQRILSRHGHLSNVAAAEALEQLASAELSQVVLAHLSQDCNRPELALRAVSDRLATIGATHIRVTAASQHAPAATLSLGLKPEPAPPAP